MDNEQVMTHNLAWLAGAFDADGHVSMNAYHNKKGNNSQIEIGWTNTCKLFLCKVLTICKLLGVNLHINPKSRPKKWKQAWTVRTGKLSKIAIILGAILPYLSTKFERAQLLYSFCIRRLNIAKEYCKNNQQSASRKYPYTSKDYWYFDQMKILNKRGQSTSTTIPAGSRTQESSKSTAQLNCDDIVWPSRKLLEA